MLTIGALAAMMARATSGFGRDIIADAKAMGQESAALLDAARDSWLHMPILLALATGCRRGEALALNWADVGDGEISFARAVRQVGGALSTGDTKNRKVRNVTIGDNVAGELRAWKREQAEQLLRLGVRQTPKTSICTRPDGRSIAPNTLTIEFWRLAKRLGLNVHYHSLRHSTRRNYCPPVSRRTSRKKGSGTTPPPSRSIDMRP
jgi:integrase